MNNLSFLQCIQHSDNKNEPLNWEKILLKTLMMTSSSRNCRLAKTAVKKLLH